MKSTFRGIWTSFFLLVFFVLTLCVGAFAQVSKGSISGTVMDSTGAAVVGADVKATSAETNQAITTVSDSSGLFKLSLLPVGSYRVEVSKAGFRTSSLSGIAVAPGVDTGLGNIKLEIGSASETVEVVAATPLIETTQSQITTTFEQTYLNNMPGIQENQGLDNLAVLLPGVSSARDNGFSNTNGGMGFSVDGIRGRNNDQQIDGQNNNDNSVAGPAVFLSDTEFVDNYQLTTNNFGAEYGRNAGSVVNISTKSGTNKWHGSIYGTESNSALTTLTNQQENTVWGEGLTKPPRFNDEFTGATIGGPWVKDKVFFFGGFDNEIVSSKTVFGDGTSTPTPTGIAQLAGCFPGSTSVAALQAYGPYAIGAGLPAPLGTPTTSYYDNAPVNNTTDPNTGNPACGYQLAGVQRTLPNGSHSYNWLARVDITGAKDTVYFRYLFNKSTFFNATGDGGTGYIGNEPGLGQDLGLSWTRKISNNMLNELRASVGRENFGFGGNSFGNTLPPDSALTTALANIAFSASNLLGYGPATNLPQGRVVNTYQIQDNWSYVHGKHQFKAGTNLTLQKSPNVFLPNVNGEFEFTDWGAYAANTPTFTSVTLGNPKLGFIEHDSFFYFGDDWKVTNHLTLNLGLTYSYYGQPANLFHNNDLRQQTGSQPFWETSLPQSVTVFPSIPAPKDSFGPNIGFAYTVENGGRLLGNNKTVFRGGYRLAYDPPFYNIYLNIASAAPQVLAQTIIPGQPLPADPHGPNVRSELASYLTLGVSDPRGFDQTSVAPDFKPDRVHSWSFGMQREFGTHAAAEIRYVGNKGENLFQSINSNPYLGCGDPGCVAPAGTPYAGDGETPGLADGIAAGVFNASLLPAGLTPCPAASAVVANDMGRVNCNGAITRERSNTGYSAYNGLQAEFRTTNLFNQLTMKTNYTWSKTTDNVSEIFSTFGGATTVAFSQDPLNYTTAEHGTSGLDFPQSWTLSFNEAIPAFKSQRGIVGHILGGWSVAGTYIMQSGQAYTPVEAYQAYAASPYDTTDLAFNFHFVGADVARPFVSNPSAPAGAIGIYAGDACNTATFFFGIPGTPACSLSPTALIDFPTFNTTLGATPATASQEHYIVNAYQEQVNAGTPYGNAGRNSLRDFHTNTGNFQISKTSNWGERVRLVWHMSMVNVFNHPNYGSIDPFIEDAGDVALGTGFANTSVRGGGNRSIRFGMKVTF